MINHLAENKYVTFSKNLSVYQSEVENDFSQLSLSKIKVSTNQK